MKRAQQHVTTTWKDILRTLGMSNLLRNGKALGVVELFKDSTAARIDVDGGGNEAWFFRDKADWEDFDRNAGDVDLAILHGESGFVRELPSDDKPSMAISVGTEKEFYEVVRTLRRAGYHGGCLFEPV